MKVTSTELDSKPMLMQVNAAHGSEAAVGVVHGRAELEEFQEPDRPESGKNGKMVIRLAPSEEAAGTGEYVAIITFGLAQVKASQPSGTIVAGTRLVVGEDGRTRALQTTEVNGIQVAESVPTIGIALDEPAADGMVWVLVNPR